MGNGSVIRRRALGRRLRELREAAGLTLEAAAPRLDWSTSTLSRIETGQQAPHVHGVRSMLDLYDAGGSMWTELVAMAREVRQKGWWRGHGIGDDSYVAFENEASSVLDYTVDYVPGLLQVPDYSRALLAASIARRTRESVDSAVAVRAIRQRRLTSADDPLTLTAVVDESVLHRPIGGPPVLAAQRAHLVVMAALPSVTLQVLPLDVGARATAGSGFIVLTFGDVGEPDLAYVEHALGATLLEKVEDVASAKLKFDRLRSDALSSAGSLALLRRVADGTWRGSGRHRGRGPDLADEQLQR